MASSVVLPAAKLIGKSLVDEVKYLYAVKNKVESLHDELVWMGCFLKDMDANQHDEMINLWVSRITDLAEDAEDIVENYLHKVSSQRRDGVWSTLKWFSCICCDALALHQVGSDTDRLKDSIAELSSRMHTYGVKTQSLGGTSKPRSLCKRVGRSLYEIDECEVVGLGSDADEVSGHLTSDSNPSVVCITGTERGSGKTTLARLVFSDSRIHACFMSKAWVYVSQQFETRRVMEGILKKLEYLPGDHDRPRSGQLGEDELCSRICEVLMKRKCLVVLDGIFFEREWAALAPAFATLTRSQSKLLLTTRNDKMLSYVPWEGVTVGKKADLNMIENFQLLQMRPILPDYQSAERDAMETLGKAMIVDCQFKPSLVVLLGAILASKKTLAEFEEVYENMRVYRDNLGSVSSILELSYYDLPYYLKPCFLHLGNFPENMEIPIKKVCRLWAIEGIVALPTGSAARRAPVEAIAEAYLEELASRQLVQLGNAGEKRRSSCRLHSLVRDMCRRKSKEENFLDVIEHRDFLVQTSSSSASLENQKLRRLAIYVHKDGNSLQQLMSDRNTQHVRTLMLFPIEEGIPFSWVQGTMSEFLKLVRVLDFEGVCISSVPSEIGDLIHLRYLSLKGTSVSNLPSTIGRLKFIQILDLRVQECIEMIIPNVIWKLERLKNLHLPNRWKVGVIRSIFRDAAEKGKLRLRGLSQLETIGNLRLEECMVKDVHKLEKLHKVSFADYVVMETEELRSFLSAMAAVPQSRKTIPAIRVNGDVLNEAPSILTSHPHPLSFNKLVLSGKLMIKLDIASTFPEFLEVLILEGCELKDDPMPILEKLPGLRELTLGANSFVGTEMVCTAENFQRLAILRLVELKSLREWQVEETAMGSLTYLFIYSCDQLTEIPSGLSRWVEVGCRPCVPGYEIYGCSFQSDYIEMLQTRY